MDAHQLDREVQGVGVGPSVAIEKTPEPEGLPVTSEKATSFLLRIETGGTHFHE
ncbi:hypothetical protein RUM44_009151 [Polyplax serrata]|uniref:Uncharacterized protein n=1 Tax=Polyplax serrata TaxID=468196 RepID=A0ABR1ARX4_POLSC